LSGELGVEAVTQVNGWLAEADVEQPTKGDL
jgi:hypothetical protein